MIAFCMISEIITLFIIAIYLFFKGSIPIILLTLVLSFFTDESYIPVGFIVFYIGYVVYFLVSEIFYIDIGEKFMIIIENIINKICAFCISILVNISNIMMGIIPVVLSCVFLVGVLSWFTGENYTNICFIISIVGFILYYILYSKLNEYKKQKKNVHIDENHERYIENERIINKQYEERQQKGFERIVVYPNKIKQVNSNENNIKSKNELYKKYDKKDIDNINDWRLFEKFVSGCFEEQGYNTILTSSTNDGGKDIIVEKNGIKFYIECKYWKAEHTIGREQIQKLAGAAMMDGVKNAIFITTSNYNTNALEAARALNRNGFNIELWNTDRLLKFINN